MRKTRIKVVSSFLAGLMTIMLGSSLQVLGAEARIISENGTYTLNGSEPVVVKSGVNAELILDGVTINSVGTSAISLEKGAEVALVVNGMNTISADANAVTAGIYVPQDAKLSINGEGTLHVTGGKYSAGIGSVENTVSGTIIIDGGVIYAQGGDRGAGIGSGYHASAGSVTINDGIVTAIGGWAGAGIGSGYGTSGGAEGKVGVYNGGEITINGGTIYSSAFSVDFSKIDPMNPEYLAKQDTNTFAAGIGGGYGASSGNITISGGDVTAVGSCGGAGIGSGRGTSKAANYDKNAFFTNINITGNAKVLAMATDDSRNKKGGGAAIGTGRGVHTGGTISITDHASVIAIASPFSAAIGAGSNNSPDGSVPSAESITITENVSLYAVSDGSRFAVDTALGTKRFAGISANIQQILFSDSVLNAGSATEFDLVFDANVEKTLSVPAGMKSVATDVANAGIYYLKSANLFGVQKDDTIEYPNNGTLEEHTCVQLREIQQQPEQPPEEEIIATDPIRLNNDFAYIFGRTSKKMAPDDPILRGEACAVLYRLLKQNNKLGGFVYDSSAEPYFDDLAGTWERSAVEYMTYIHVYDNSSVTQIRPYDPITRKEAFKLFALALQFTKQTNLTYDQYASILFDSGYIWGDENGNLNLNDEITRAEYCKVYNMIIGRDDMSLFDAEGEEITAETYGFEDLSQDDWYYEIMLKATSAYTDGYVDFSKRAERNAVDDFE